MEKPKMATAFAPGERASEEDLKKQSGHVSEISMLARVFNLVPGILMVLNKERQVVFANRSFLDYLNIQDANKIRGLRMGEVLGCVHADETEGGCGTSESCQMCGGIRAILASMEGKTGVQECRLLRKGGEALDFKIQASPFPLGQQIFTVLSVSDISQEKRRKALERIFFTDLLSTATDLQGNVQRLFQEEIEEPRKIIHELTGHLVEDLNMQRILTAAESGRLTVRPGEVYPLDALKEVAGFFLKHSVARGRNIRTDDKSVNTAFQTEKTLLKVVLSHMIRNALEATRKNGTVFLGVKGHPKEVEFWVHNEGEMSREVRLQIFNRSFSTKGDGRGLGTYAMKLLGERYLKGQISFKTSALDGTTFRAIFPLQA